MAWHLTSPPTDAPWSPPLLPPLLVPPHALDDPETHPAPPSLTPGPTVPCSRSHRVTAPNLATLIRSGEAERLWTHTGTDVRWQVQPNRKPTHTNNLNYIQYVCQETMD